MAALLGERFPRSPFSRSCISLAALALWSCSGDSDGDDNADDTAGGDISMAPLSGMVGGQPWMLAAAQTDSFLSDETTFWVDAYADQPTQVCDDFFFSAQPSLILNIPPTVGEYDMSLTLNATFALNDAAQTNLVATQGHISVTSVTATELSVGIRMEYDADNTVEGRLTASVCP